MAASINDKFTEATNGSRPVATTLTAILPSGASPGTATCGALTGWPTATAVHFIIYTVDVNGRKVSGSQTDWKGVVSGSTITGLVLKAGTNNGYSIGAVVEAAPTAAWADDVTEGIAVEHNQDGTHKDTLVGMLAGTQTFTGVKTFNAIKFNAPQGFLINGQISRSVSSNNLTVAIKTLAGTDPSASDPVYCRIGNTIRSITAALSVTKNAGTNWMNLGSTETAATDADVFVYLGYNATDGVVIGFCRLPGIRTYGEFSATTTNEAYCAISTITTAASTDEYECIGRVNVTLGVTASFNWSVPATSIIINRPIDETRWLSCTNTVLGGALGNGTVTYSQYKVLRDKWCRVRYKAVGGTTSSFSAATNGNTLPFSVENQGNLLPLGLFQFFDSSSGVFYPGEVGSESTANNTRWLIMDAASTYMRLASVSNTVPADWDTSDVISYDLEFKIA